MHAAWSAQIRELAPVVLNAADRAGLSAVEDNHLAEMALVVLLEPAGLTLAALLAE